MKTAIPIKKEIGIFVEPIFKLIDFQKLTPKFYKGPDPLVNNCQDLNFTHEITNNEIEMLEIDEKLPQKRIGEYESNRIRSIINDTFPFHFLIEIEKCYLGKYYREKRSRN